MVTPDRVTLTAATAHGLYNGIQTIRQLLPVWIDSPSVLPGPWTMPAVRITDYPRYTYRGVMLDIARHYEPPAAVERLIAQAAAQWDFTEDVGYSALCPDSENTWTIMSAIIHQLDAMTPGAYHDLGGDEVPSTLLSQSQYADFINKEAGIIAGAGKTVMGWADIAGPGTELKSPSVAEYWNPDSGTQPGTITGTEAVTKGMRVVMAPANHAYLDQKYVAGRAGNVPPTLGLSWACNSGCDVDQFYDWDPGSYVTGVTDRNVTGVEGAMWSETVVNLSNVDYMVFPRLPALAELAWSPKADRTSTSSPAYLNFVGRLAGQGGRWLASGQNFYPSTEVPWRLDLTAANAVAASGGSSATVATLAAPGRAASAVTATINWGDGTSSAGTVSGAAATPTTVNGLYSVSGSHRYAHPGLYDAAVTVSAPGTAAVTAHFSARG